MDELRIIFIKISIWIIITHLLLIVCAFIAIKKTRGKKTKAFLKIIGVLLSVILIWKVSCVVKDNIDFSLQKITVMVVEKRYRSGGFRNTPILMDNKNEYYFYFWSPYVEEGKTYEITYLPNTEAVVKAVEIKK
ncbi:hypothetical protein [Oceanirhabdus sp. W0125-5]|uniref:hypothetical protein n=1 Tax=Oceanirhabdus sp. W0125-5 TaxID=2999116 RepID=UPI0022F2AD98|nr:hypothetical protein [Oceanirhabdus sp. W0125-5]WBW97310.1 hypothetical protein OW730_00210 [Oceanirhabdus sp. W0125-5]